MKIEIQVKPNARKEEVVLLESGVYRVSVNAPPQEGRANRAVIALLAQHFNVPKRAVTIVRGETGKKKWVEVG